MQKRERRLPGVDWTGVIIIVCIIWQLLVVLLRVLWVIILLLLLLGITARVERHEILRGLCEGVFVVVLLWVGMLGVHCPLAGDLVVHGVEGVVEEGVEGGGLCFGQ